MFSNIRAIFVRRLVTCLISQDESVDQSVRDRFKGAGGTIVTDNSAMVVIVPESMTSHPPSDLPVLNEHWILDSVKIEKRLCEHEYLVPITAGKFSGQTFYWEGYNPEFDKNEEIEDMLKMIRDNGGLISTEYDQNVTTVISQYTCESFPWFGVTRVQSPYWLHKQLYKKSPEEHFDFPCPPDPIQAIDPVVLTFTGFDDWERLDVLQAHAEIMGATCQPALSRTTTVLVNGGCESSLGSEKLRMARKWGIRVCQESWLLECYSKWRWI